VSGLDAIIHLAGEPIVGFWSREKKRRILESRTDLTADLVDSIARVSRSRRPEALVSVSAIGYYGNRGDEWLDEEADVGFGFLPLVCREWEAASQPASKLGVRLVNPRMGVVLGQGGFLKRVRSVFKLGLGGKLGSGNQWMSWIHSKDAARILLECAENQGIRGRVNCVSPNPVQNREFTSTYSGILGRIAVIPVPAFFLKRLPGGMGQLFLDSQRVLPGMMNAFGFEWQYEDLGEALREVEGKELPAEDGEEKSKVNESTVSPDAEADKS
ncbi:UNVERIFIED_CONTAM: hypothetical protein GTU68_056129, partial [Idotea baltica]|nr:hypothetical protein [Idotea baltica]